MAYDVFTKAGVPAPRCAFAHVVVNGEDLGLYSNVEAVKKPFLAEHFGDDSGNLYEGSGGADFRDGFFDHFEQKTNGSTPAQDALKAVSDALLLPASKRNAKLEELVDMDELMKFWAAESLLSHWDGYSGDLNNFFVYERPDTHKLVFIPWGPDAAFQKVHPFLPKTPTRPQSVLAWARLPGRLYADADMQKRYRDTLRDQLENAWDEDAMLKQVDRIADLAGDAASTQMLADQRAFIMGRRAELKQELDQEPAPKWSYPERLPGSCVADKGTPVSGTFKATWGDINAAKTDASLALTVMIDGKPQKLTALMSAAGMFTDMATGTEYPAVRLLGFRSDGSFALVQLGLGVGRKLAAGKIPFHGLETVGIVLHGTSMTAITTDGLIGEGTITFDKAGMTDGDEISGHFEGVASNYVEMP
jgi:hypothetical protein